MGTLSVHKTASKDRISARVNHDIYQTIVKAAEVIVKVLTIL